MNEHISIIQGYIDHLEFMKKHAYELFDRKQADRDIEAFKVAIKALEQEPKTGWIPVSERLPEKPDVYTVTDSKGDVVRFVFDATESSRDYWLRCAKAWMLIEPYREAGI